jgi:type II secretory pathway pseudopilin PulG
MKIVWFKNKKGITLVELLVTMSILMIVAAPFLSTFLSAAKNNALSQEILDSTAISQKVMEEIKARPLFLDSEAVTDLEAPLTDYNEYGTYGDYTIKYKIIREDGTLSPLNDTYGFLGYEDLTYDLEYFIDSGEVSLNGTE